MDTNNIPALFLTHPAVFAVGQQYQIMLPTARETLVSVVCGGEEYFDASNGVMRSKCSVHRVSVPMSVLDAAGEYTVCCRPLIDRKPYFPETQPLCRFSYAFRPLNKATDICVTHISDTHGLVDAPVLFARPFSPDLLVVNGDIADHSGSEENMLTLYRLVSAITGGEIPCVFSRGNHDLRGALAERLAEFTPTDDGRAYYTFRVGCVWGIVLDCGEDKDDSHAEYGHTVCCHAYRRQVTRFLERVIAHADEEYAADGVKYRLVLAHNPFTHENVGEFCIEKDTFGRWVELLRAQVKPHLMLSGHKHLNEVWLPGNERDTYGQTWPTVVASRPDIGEKRYAGASVVLQEDHATVIYADSEQNRLSECVLSM